MGNTNPRFAPPFTSNQIYALTMIPRFSSWPSLIGCCIVIWDVLSSKTRRQRSYHRLVLVMSIHDFIWAFCWFLSTWPVPKSFPTFDAKGNNATCQATAFFSTGASRASVFYSGCLAVMFLLVIKHGWRENKLRIAERWMHIVCCVVSWGIAIICFPLTLYNPFITTCSIQSYPLGCTQSYRSSLPDNPPNCIRGDNAGIYQFVFQYVWTWIAFIVVTYCMVSIYWHIHRQEQSVSRYSYNASRAKDFRKSRKFATQGALYCIFFVLVWIFPTVATLMGQFFQKQNYVLLVLAVLMASFQGFFNTLIYFRPRYMTYRETQQKKQNRQQQRSSTSQNSQQQQQSSSSLPPAPPQQRSHSVWEYIQLLVLDMIFCTSYSRQNNRANNGRPTSSTISDTSNTDDHHHHHGGGGGGDDGRHNGSGASGSGISSSGGQRRLTQFGFLTSTFRTSTSNILSSSSWNQKSTSRKTTTTSPPSNSTGTTTTTSRQHDNINVTSNDDGQTRDGDTKNNTDSVLADNGIEERNSVIEGAVEEDGISEHFFN